MATANSSGGGIGKIVAVIVTGVALIGGLIGIYKQCTPAATGGSVDSIQFVSSGATSFRLDVGVTVTGYNGQNLTLYDTLENAQRQQLGSRAALYTLTPTSDKDSATVSVDVATPSARGTYYVFIELTDPNGVSLSSKLSDGINVG